MFLGLGFVDVLQLIIVYSDIGYSTFLIVLIYDPVGNAERSGGKKEANQVFLLHVTQIRPQVLSSRKTICKDPHWKKNSITATVRKHNYGFVFSFHLVIARRSYTEVPKAAVGPERS